MRKGPPRSLFWDQGLAADQQRTYWKRNLPAPFCRLMTAKGSPEAPLAEIADKATLGPNACVYPAGKRSLGFSLTARMRFHAPSNSLSHHTGRGTYTNMGV